MNSRQFDDCPVDFGINPRDVVDTDRVIGILAAHNITAGPTPDGRIRITGKLGALARLALDDARLALEKNAAGDLETARDITSHEITYYWWIIFQGLTRRYVQENQGSQANFCDYMVTQQLEPAYNFRGIEARPASENTFRLSWLLTAYVLATLWYGAALYAFSEGIGLSLSKSHRKTER